MSENLGGENPWVVPGSAVPGAFTEPAAVPPAGTTLTGQEPSPVAGSPVRGERTPGSVPQVALRPMTVADILDGAFSIIKARPLRLLGIAAVFVVPVHLLAAYIQRDLVGGAGLVDVWFNSDDPAVLAEQGGSDGSAFWATILVWIVPGIALMFVAAAVSKLVGAWTAGEDPPAGQLLRSVGRLWWPLLAGFVCVHLVEGAGLITCYIGSVAAMAFYSVTAPVIGAENLGPIEAMKRSARLVGSQFWRVLGINILIAIVDALLTTALGGLPEVLAGLFSWDLDVAWIIVAAGNIIGAVIATPFVAAAAVLLYLDLRIRTEGLDIELTARQLVDDKVR